MKIFVSNKKPLFLLPFHHLLFPLCECTGRQGSLTLATATKSTTEVSAAQQKSLECIAKVVLDNRIALHCLLAKQAIKSVLYSKYLLLCLDQHLWYYSKYRRLTNKPLNLKQYPSGTFFDLFDTNLFGS